MSQEKILLTEALKPRAKHVLESVANLTAHWTGDLLWNSYTCAEELDGKLLAQGDVAFYRGAFCGGVCSVRFRNVTPKAKDGQTAQAKPAKVLAKKTIDRQSADLRNNSDASYDETYNFTLSQTTSKQSSFRAALEVAVKQGIEAGNEVVKSTTELSTTLTTEWGTVVGKEQTQSRSTERTFHLGPRQAIHVDASRSIAEMEQEFTGELDFTHDVEVYSQAKDVTFYWHSLEDFIAAATGVGAANLWLADLYRRSGGINSEKADMIRQVAGGELSWTARYQDVGELDVQVTNVSSA